MITKDEIRKQIVCYWSAEDESFIAESAAIPDVIIGLGETRKQAIMDFETALNSMYDSIKADKVAGYKSGRPAKNYVPLNVNLRQSTKGKISALANAFRISQGEAVDYLMFFYECKVNEIAPVMEKNEIVHLIKDATKYIVSMVKPSRTEEAPLAAQTAGGFIAGKAPANYIIMMQEINAASSLQVENSRLPEAAMPLLSNSRIESEFAYARAI